MNRIYLMLIKIKECRYFLGIYTVSLLACRGHSIKGNFALTYSLLGTNWILGKLFSGHSYRFILKLSIADTQKNWGNVFMKIVWNFKKIIIQKNNSFIQNIKKSKPVYSGELHIRDRRPRLALLTALLFNKQNTEI